MRNLQVFLLLGAVALGACKKKEAEETGDQNKETTAAKEEPKEEPKAPEPDPELVKRGAYIANVMMCGVCHTPMGPKGPDMEKAFAGGFEVPEVFGTWRSPNITQDKKTGIGDWTDEQIIAAVRQGKRPDGTTMYPVMPYPFFNVLSDDDAKALVAFLRTLPAIENAVEGNTDLKLPKPEVPKPAGAAPAPEKQGEYLATLMHCSFCHTPMDPKTFEPDMSKAFAGGMPLEIPKPFEPMMGKGTLYAANITSDPATGIGKWTEEQILAALKTVKRPDGSAIRGPMQMFAAAVLPGMTDEDTKALAAYVKGLPPVKNKVPKAKYTPPAGPPPGHGDGH